MSSNIHTIRTFGGINRTLPPALLFFCASLWSTSAAATDPWVQAQGDGFGDKSNIGVGWLQGFNGAMYAALDRATNSVGGAMLYRSTDLTNWSQVVGPGTATVLGDTVTEIIRMTVNGASDLYFGTHDASRNPARVYHSADGATWTHITSIANGYAPSGNSSIGGLAAQGTNLFVATVNDAGAQIWKCQLGGAGFSKVADFGSGLHLATGANPNVNFVSYLYAASNGVVYASTSHLVNGAPASPQNGFLYQSSDAGTTWTRNRGVGNGFGNANNWHISCLLEFRGCLYGAVNNSSTGGELWRTSDGLNWVNVLTNGINDRRNIELHHLSVDNGFLWVATMPRPGVADEVWRSSDGTNFVQSNLSGFGDTNNFSRFPSVGGLGPNEFFGCENYLTGAQIWRLGPVIDQPIVQAVGADGNLHLAWPALALGFNLESTTNPAAAIWTQATNATSVVDSQNTVSINSVTPRQFYRLRRP
jgi:hypothetical protein